MKRFWRRFSVVLAIITLINLFIPYVIPASNLISVAEAATIKLNKSKIAIKVGETYQLELKGTKAKIKWSSNKKSIATVSPDGLVTGIKSGNMNIIAKVGKKTYVCVVTVMYPTLSKSNFKAGIGDTLQLAIKNLPLTIVKDDIQFNSDNNEVAIVDDTGLITAISEGYTIIRVTFGTYKLQCGVFIEFTDENKEDAIKSLEIEYTEINNQIVCIIKNNSAINLTFGYDLAFYDASDNLVSISGITGIRDGFFKGDSKILYFDRTQKEYSYYKIRLNDIWGQYNYLDVKDKVDITATEAYDYTYKYTETISGYPINKIETVKVIDLNVNNRSENRVMLEAYVVYYKDNSIVNIENFSKWNGNIDVGSTTLKNPLTTGLIGGKVTISNYDTFKLIYTARTLKY